MRLVLILIAVVLLLVFSSPVDAASSTAAYVSDVPTRVDAVLMSFMFSLALLVLIVGLCPYLFSRKTSHAR